jgi:hypothetical protein
MNIPITNINKDSRTKNAKGHFLAIYSILDSSTYI